MADDLPAGYEQYDEWSVADVREAVADEADPGVLDYLLAYEQAHKDRKTATAAITQRLQAITDDADAAASAASADSDAMADPPTPQDLSDEDISPPANGDDADADAESAAVTHRHRTGGHALIYVRNPTGETAHIGQWSFAPGEVKEVRATDKVRELLRRGTLQHVSER